MPPSSTGSPPRFVVVGLGGYGLVHLDAVRWLQEQGLATLQGVVALEVDRKARPDLTASLIRKGIRLFESTDEFFASGISAEVLTVPVGIAMHVPLSIAALRAGLHVYCEKPVAATVQEVDQLIVAARETGKTVAVGFQHIWSRSIQRLKERIVGGRLGAVRLASIFCGWPRSKEYYSRNEWTGKLRLGKDWILDSPANNAHAHYLMNLLYLCGSTQGTAATPVKVRAELYRANQIEGPDTVQLKIETETGARLHLSFTHANAAPSGPSLTLSCEHGNAYWDGDNGATLIRYADGGTEEFDNLSHEKWRFDGFADLVRAIGEGREPLCTPAIARAQTLAVNAMHESCPRISTIPGEAVQIVEDWEMFPPNTRGIFRRVADLDRYLRVGLKENAFLSELGVSWAQGESSTWFQPREYRRFPASPSWGGG